MSGIPIDQAFDIALAHHQAGQLAEAEMLYRQILTAQPRHADALHMLGVIAHQVGRQDVALDLIQKAIALSPTAPAFHCNLGETYRRLGRHEEAVAAFHRAIQLQPNYAKGYNNLAVALMDQSRFAEAETALRRAIEIQPDYAPAHKILSVALRSQRRADEAVAAGQRAIQFGPSSADAHNILGLALLDQGRAVEAAAVLRRAIELQPHYVEAHCNLGIALRDQGRLEEATAVYRRALELKPDSPEVHNNLGVALMEQDLLADAVIALRRATALRPDYAEALCNLGNALRNQGLPSEAAEAYRQAIQLEPDDAEAHNCLGTVLMEQHLLEDASGEFRRATELRPHYGEAEFNHSLLLLLRGDFEKGWPLYERRWDLPGVVPYRRDFSQPAWSGQPPQGKCILIHAEQGLGDTLQFVRYAPMIAALGAHVILECQPELKTLLESVECISEVIIHGDSLPSFDFHCPLLSLPLAFATRVETIPNATPYVSADPLKVNRWREHLERQAGTSPTAHPALKVGLVWAGRSSPGLPEGARTDRRRSLLLSQLAPLAKVRDVFFVSLQKGEAAAQAKTPPEGMNLIDWTDELHDFTDTAALIEALDLVISVDTAVAHLAGALGKPVWLLNRFDTCWRWLLEREDSPWYPTLRIFRQEKFGDWPPVIERVAGELASLNAPQRKT